MPSIGPFRISPLCLGANVFGWTASEREAHRLLDAYVGAGGRVVDTADSYSHWADGHVGGESEAIVGSWLSRPGRRERIVLATKVGSKPDRRRLDRPTMRRALDDSLARLRTDIVDVWFLHRDDGDTPLEETAAALAELHREGKFRALGVSNFAPARLDELVRACAVAGVRPVALQAHYNLLDRDCYEGELRARARRHGLATLPYFGLARGFLTGAYRPGVAIRDSPRAPYAAGYLAEPRGPRTLRALDAVARAHRVPVAAVALAWLAQQPTVAAPIASARNVEQLRSLLPMATLTLTVDERRLLASAARPSEPER